MRKACVDSGFFYIRDHGVPEELLAAIFEDARRFFRQPDDIKRKIDIAKSPYKRGYEPLRAQTLELDAPPDLKESVLIGTELSESDPRVRAGVFGHGPNQWPDGLPGWRDTIEAYQAAMLELAKLVMRGLALSLDLPEDAFRLFCDDPIATLRLLHYPPQPANALPNEKGCGAHTDWGGLTLLLQDDLGGLELWNERAGWIPAAPLPGTFVVNIGDMMARWTNDLYQSTLHRVVNRSGRDRISVPFFLDGRGDVDVRCISTCLIGGQAPKYAPTTPARHLEEMYRRTYSG
jgi:isopenicillin N synthase-like dioxygenase